jgi:hypothetical protein
MLLHQILISTEDKWLIMILSTFKCSVTELPSLILRRYNLFLRNNLFTRDFNWYKLPNLSHSFLAEYSPETFRNTESARQSRIVLLNLLSNFSHSSIDIPIDMVPRQIVVHCSQSTRRSLILSLCCGHNTHMIFQTYYGDPPYKFWSNHFLYALILLILWDFHFSRIFGLINSLHAFHRQLSNGSSFVSF